LTAFEFVPVFVLSAIIEAYHMEQTADVIIIGAGIAGLAAGKY
jgi:ribulose 1,5-bisphosphate synthetase/thiazole synthase